MKKVIIDLFQRDKKPTKGLFAFEWVAMAYLALTLLMIFFCYTKLVNPGDMLYARARFVIITILLWGLYRAFPCKLMVILRVACQSTCLSWWYADTYELNRILPNLDHVFASAEQSIFGCQPAELFSQVMPWPVWSELMYLGYYSYFYLVAMCAVLYCCCKYDEFIKTTSIILGSFFLFYVIFDFLPVTGPQYYYEAIGMQNVSQGTFPDVGMYFLDHQNMMKGAGWDEGFFHSMVHSGAVAEGERPTAAFPSSHVGVSTVVGWLLIHLCRKRRSWGVMYFFVPLYCLLCMATVYIRAHYLIDAIVGFFVGTAMYFGLNYLYDKKISKI